jgi:hypothetical protein
MSHPLQLHDLVALLEDVPTRHFETGEPLLLLRGQMGTVVMLFDGSACEVEFADREGRAYALLTIPFDKLMLLRDSPESAAA